MGVTHRSVQSNQFAAIDELANIAADRLGRNAHVGRELAYADCPELARALEDAELSSGKGHSTHAAMRMTDTR